MTTVVSLVPTRQKLSRFPSTLENFARVGKPLPARCVIPRTAGHSWDMGLFTMPKYLNDNRIVASVFVALTFVNAAAIQHNWYG